MVSVAGEEGRALECLTVFATTVTARAAPANRMLHGSSNAAWRRSTYANKKNAEASSDASAFALHSYFAAAPNRYLPAGA
jgi:hypothetical protein